MRKAPEGPGSYKQKPRDKSADLLGLQIHGRLRGGGPSSVQVREGEVACVQGGDCGACSLGGPSVKGGGRKEAKAGSPGGATNPEDRVLLLVSQRWEGWEEGSSKDPPSSLGIRIPYRVFSR